LIHKLILTYNFFFSFENPYKITHPNIIITSFYHFFSFSSLPNIIFISKTNDEVFFHSTFYLCKGKKKKEENHVCKFGEHKTLETYQQKSYSFVFFLYCKLLSTLWSKILWKRCIKTFINKNTFEMPFLFSCEPDLIKILHS